MATKTVLAMAAAVGLSLLAGGGAWASATATPQQAADDARITGEVQSQLARDFPGWANEIQVTTREDGVVTLSGYAKTEDGEQKAIEDAHAVRGVKRVRNELRLVG